MPIKLDAEMKLRILDEYKAILDDISHDELRYVASKLPKVYKRLSKNPDNWTALLALYAKSIFSEVKLNAGKTFTEEGKHAIAALFYLCEPIDIIPDYTPGIGYLDDALVINQSLTDIKKIDKNLYNRIIKRVNS